MTNVIKADLYRITRSKGIYISFAILLFFQFLETIGEAGTVGVNVSSGEGTEAVNTVADALIGMNMPFIIMQRMDNYLYILLAFIVIVAATDFSTSTVKNTLACGISRVQYFMAKFTLLGTISTLMVTISFVFPTLLATAKNGFGGEITGDYLQRVFVAYLLEVFLFLAVVCISLLFVFVTKRTAYVNTLFIMFTLLPMLLIFGFSQIIPDLLKLFKYEAITNIRYISQIAHFTSSDYSRVILVGLSIMIISFAGVVLSFRKCDIK